MARYDEVLGRLPATFTTHMAADAAETAQLDLLAISCRVPRAIVCLVSALVLHDLTDEVPIAAQFAVPRSRNLPVVSYPPRNLIPGVVITEYPQLLADGGFQIQGYPLETVPAEKLTTAISLGDANTRERDWADLWRLTGRHEMNGSSVCHAGAASLEPKHAWPVPGRAGRLEPTT